MKALFLSKSSSYSCRAVITGDPYIGLDVVGVPDEVARRMSVQECVTNYNIARLQDMMEKGLCLTYTIPTHMTWMGRKETRSASC
jgi:DNA-directed RNA polymerase-5 subunit 1